jgi:hypothetical protein
MMDTDLEEIPPKKVTLLYAIQGSEEIGVDWKEPPFDSSRVGEIPPDRCRIHRPTVSSQIDQYKT